MGFKSIELKLHTDFSPKQLQNKISRELHIKDFSFQIENKSLDARKKSNIFWLVKVAVSSPELKGEEAPERNTLEISYKKRNRQITVVGSGPAGFFAAFVLQKAGFNVTLVERGSEVIKRGKSISAFEKTGIFDPQNNYAFGEGGAGTFSDGKLTSRSKHISEEKQFILESYINTGAPEEILYMAHPHLGTDNLRKMKGFETGNLIGFESKTSSPVQVVREKNGLCVGFENLFLIGEGSGYAGGIISSAADGVKAALQFVNNG